ncbi:ParA family protein [Klebsiella aerogenes]|uniref:ParA family protein n=1 Tax=Klebsiella aerogenes TaxID=548 RepID=UPI001865C03B|nr:ParA family protein [Klebsiella aerogenes]HBW0091096.1 ParA family protein [Klebsiella aerogenes]
MAVIVGFISEKGGVGKTTSCYHIAEALSRYHKKKVLVIDADYQRGGITGRFFPRLIENFGNDTPKGITLFNKYQQLYSAAEQSSEIDILEFDDNIDVIPADPRLSTVSTDKLPSTNNIRSNNAALLQHLRTIKFVLSSIESNYDYILIDSHPEVSDVMRSIIYASDYCVSPVKLDRQSSIGVATVIGEIKNVNDDIAMLRTALNVGDSHRDTVFAGAMGMMAREYAEELKQTEQLEYNRLRQAGDIFEHYVTEGDGLRVAAAERISVYDVQINNAYKQASQFRNLTNEFMRICR